MIFSNKIHKILDGENVSLFSKSQNELFIYIYNNSLRKYQISENSNKNCAFIDKYNYKKIIHLEDNKLAIGSNGYITIINEN